MSSIMMGDFDFQHVGKQVLQIEREALVALEQHINHHFAQACETILRCSGKIVVMGMGKSGHIGRKIAATFASTGTPAFFIHPSEASHGDLGMLVSQDIVLAISNSGESHEILTLVPALKRRNIPLICMTNSHDSSLGKVADIHLCIKVPKEACPLGLAPTASTTATIVMGDALAIALLQARGFTTEHFALYHPGGNLGKKLLLRVTDVMHSGDAIPRVHHEVSLREALLEMTRKKLGLTVVCDDLNNIAGIFTDGDLRRVFNTVIDLNEIKIADVMTKGGVQVTSTLLAVNALNLMQEKSITALLVAEDKRLIGVVHMHDLLKAGIV